MLMRSAVTLAGVGLLVAAAGLLWLGRVAPERPIDRLSGDAGHRAWDDLVRPHEWSSRGVVPRACAGIAASIFSTMRVAGEGVGARARRRPAGGNVLRRGRSRAPSPSRLPKGSRRSRCPVLRLCGRRRTDPGGRGDPGSPVALPICMGPFTPTSQGRRDSVTGSGCIPVMVVSLGLWRP